ncbi:MAG TPA: hypothetical protein VIJ33_08785, partial [Solirubrobacteraceae bacterium]
MSATPGSDTPTSQAAAIPKRGLNARSTREVVRAGFRTDYDIARVYRLISGATLIGGLGALVHAQHEGDLAPWQRRLCMITGAGYAATGLFGVWVSPSHVALWFQRRPRRTLIASFAPLLLSGVTGGARTPLYRLVTIGVATGAGVRGGRRDAQLQSVLAGVAWCAGAAVQRKPAEDPLHTYIEIPLGFVLLARLASTASQVAYDSRNLFDQVFEFAYEREDLEPYLTRLTGALEKMRAALLVAATAEAAAGVEGTALRDQVLASLGRLEERLGVLWVASLSTFDLETLVASASVGWRGRIGAGRPAIILGSCELESMLTSRVETFKGLQLGLPPVNVTVGADVTVSGLRQLALIGACVTAGVANIARHAPEATQVEIRLTGRDGQLTLTVTDDGPATHPPTLDAERQPSGLTHLREQLERFGGSLKLEMAGRHGLQLRVRCPATGGAQGFEFWATEIRELISTSLHQAVALAAVKSAAGIALAEFRAQRAGASTQQSRRTSLLQLATPAAAEFMLARPVTRQRPELHALALAIAVPLTHHASRHGRPPAASWLNAFTSRYAFVLPHARKSAYALAGLNAAALLTGTVRRPPREMASLTRELVSMIFGPALMSATINAGQPRIRALEHAINERLAEVEYLHELANSFHSDHPAAPKIIDLAPMVADEALGARLKEKLEAIESADEALLQPTDSTRDAVQVEDPLARLGALLRRRAPVLASTSVARAIWPETESYHSPTIGVPAAERLGSYLARALARRIWPATVQVRLDARTLRYLPANAVTSAAFRREAT